MEGHRVTARWRVLWWGLVVAWLVVIWQFGESQGLPLMPSGDVAGWLVRKALHLVVYGVLGGLLVLALGSRAWPAWVVGLCLLVTPGRPAPS